LRAQGIELSVAPAAQVVIGQQVVGALQQQPSERP